MYQHGRLGKVFTFGFGLNDATGNHINGSPVQCFVRRAGASADAAPVISSASAVNLTHANYPTGLYEIRVSAETSTGFSAGEVYHVFAMASASGLSTVACIGTFELSAQLADVITIDGASATAAFSAITYIAVQSAGRDIGVLSAQAASVVARQALIDYDVPTSADVSVLVAAGPGGLTSAACSVIVAGALTNYDVPTSADVSAIVEAVSMTSASVSTLMRQVLIDYDVPTSADVSVIVAAGPGGLTSAAASVIVAGALANYDVPTSADVSALISTIGYIANLSALRAVGVLSAQAASVVAAQALADYDAATSADVSAIVADRVSAGFKILTLTEPAGPIDFASVTPAGALAWLVMLANNRMVQTSAVTRIQSSAGVEIASASVAYDGTTFTRGPWVG